MFPINILHVFEFYDKSSKQKYSYVFSAYSFNITLNHQKAHAKAGYFLTDTLVFLQPKQHNKYCWEIQERCIIKLYNNNYIAPDKTTEITRNFNNVPSHNKIDSKTTTHSQKLARKISLFYSLLIIIQNNWIHMHQNPKYYTVSYHSP